MHGVRGLLPEEPTSIFRPDASQEAPSRSVLRAVLVNTGVVRDVNPASKLTGSPQRPMDSLSHLFRKSSSKLNEIIDHGSIVAHHFRRSKRKWSPTGSCVGRVFTAHEYHIGRLNIEKKFELRTKKITHAILCDAARANCCCCPETHLPFVCGRGGLPPVLSSPTTIPFIIVSKSSGNRSE